MVNIPDMDICKCIADLLTVHNCVIVPGLGGFIGNYSPARIDPVHHAFQPPFKKLLFNVNLKQNDGLLANAVADAFGTSYNDACILIGHFAEECRLELKSGRFFVLPGVGRLYAGREGNIQFEQEKGINLLPDSFGLVPFVSPPVDRSRTFLSVDQPGVASALVRSGKRILVRRPLRWAAILVLPLGLAAVIGVTGYDRISQGTTSDANILGSVFSRFSAASLVDKKEAPKSRVSAKVIPAVTTPAALPETKATTSVSAISTKDSYAIIVGAFRFRENAENYVAALTGKGIDAAIFDRSRTGLYRVTIGTCSQHEEAVQLLTLARSSDFGDAWLLAK